MGAGGNPVLRRGTETSTQTVCIPFELGMRLQEDYSPRTMNWHIHPRQRPYPHESGPPDPASSRAHRTHSRYPATPMRRLARPPIQSWHPRISHRACRPCQAWAGISRYMRLWRCGVRMAGRHLCLCRRMALGRQHRVRIVLEEIVRDTMSAGVGGSYILDYPIILCPCSEKKYIIEGNGATYGYQRVQYLISSRKQSRPVDEPLELSISPTIVRVFYAIVKIVFEYYALRVIRECI